MTGRGQQGVGRYRDSELTALVAKVSKIMSSEIVL